MAIRITQAGVALTVGIIIVTGLIIGGFFWVKNSGEQARREDAIKIAEQNLQDQSSGDVALNDGKASEEGDKATSGDDTTKSDDKTSESTDSTTKSDTDSSQTVTELPKTGPTDQLATLLVTAILTYTVVSYVSSRQQLRSNGMVGSSEL